MYMRIYTASIKATIQLIESGFYCDCDWTEVYCMYTVYVYGW